jgi:hypothetical protein
VDKPRYLPQPDRLSILAATILLVYAISRFIELEPRTLAMQLPGVYLEVQINVYTVVSFLVLGLTAAGADWLLRDHPAIGRHSTIEHWLLPTLTAWVIGQPLFSLPIGPLWWTGFGLGGGLLMLVLVAEYIAVDPDDVRQPAAAAGLIAVSFALFLALVVELRVEELRLFQIIPLLGLGAGLVSLRTFHLRLRLWAFVEAGLVAFLVGQIGAALFYWRISPAAYGLILLGPAYGLTSLISSLADGEGWRQALVEPVLVLMVFWGAALWLR